MVIILKISSCYLEELAEEAFDLTKYLLQLALSVGVRVEWIDRWHDGVQLQTTLWHVPYIINTSRGPVVDNNALLTALLWKAK